MKLSAAQVAVHLKKDPLLSCYWCYGDEALQQQEARQALLDQARKNGFNERQLLDEVKDAPTFLAELNSASLFAEKKIVELRLSSNKLSEALVEALKRYAPRINPQVFLLITTPKLEPTTLNAAHMKQFEQVGAFIVSNPISKDQLPEWLSNRLAQVGLSTPLSGLTALADLTEGNLLAAAQAVAQLALLYPHSVLSLEQIHETVIPQAHYEIFQLSDAFLLKDTTRAVRICRTLRATGVEIMLVWAILLKEVRTLVKLEQAQKRGLTFAKAAQQYALWEKRKPYYQKALQNGCQPLSLLKDLAYIEQLIKTQSIADPWLALERLMVGQVKK